MKKLVALLFVVMLPVSATAEVVDLNIGEDSARLNLQGPFSRLLNDTQGVYDLGLLSNRDSSRKLVQGHAGVLLSGDVGAREAAIQAGLGARFLIADVNGAGTSSAVALGGQIEGRIPQLVRLGFLAQVYGAPSATSFSDLDRYIEYALAIDYQIIRQASVYLGYRNVNYKFSTGSGQTVDSGLHLGVRLNF